jgi:hypothetical protein
MFQKVCIASEKILRKSHHNDESVGAIDARVGIVRVFVLVAKDNESLLLKKIVFFLIK